MKMFKRLAAVLLAGVMVLAMLTACSGTADSAFETSVQEAYLAALNEELGTSLRNNNEVKTLAAKTLDNIDADGQITSANVSNRASTKKKYVGAIVGVEDALTTKSVYTAISYDEATTETITVNKDMITAIASAVRAMIQSGEQAGVKVNLAGLGVATKTVDGKTYVAIGFKLTK